MQSGQALPAFLLEDGKGGEKSFPSGRPSIVCFVKDDCPTCHVVMPVLDAMHQALGERIDFFVAGQTAEGNRALTETFAPTFPVLDDASLKVSFAYDIDTVPSLFLADEQGALQQRLVGFVREEWQALAESLTDGGVSNVDWAALPEWRPGCGSLSVDPLIADRLRAEAENSPLRARKIEIAPADDEFEFMFDQGFSDGLPLVPPTPERVMRMLSGTQRDPQEVLGVMPPNMGDVTVEKVAINAVMAGCRSEYMPVILAALEALLTEEYNIHGVMATTMGASPVMVVNGPIRERIGMNMKLGALGQGNRANATIGRAVRLAVRNIGGAKPGGTERSTLGNPMKFTMCFAEHEERSPWEPLHVERGFNADDSVVTLFTMTSGPTLIVDQDSRAASQLAGSFGLSLEAAFHPKAHFSTDVLLVVCPEHVDTLTRDGYSKADVRARIQEVTARPLEELVENETSAVGFKRAAFEAMDPEARARVLPKFKTPDDIHMVVAGSDAGKFSGAFHGWATGAIGSISVSKKIEEA
ncbi:MAG: redoxin domain-containing protein [Gammaproteobacteria bacterium]|nr:MAG: redoxin domain-containing protein [Gammaproteobacteria bacterium]